MQSINTKNDLYLKSLKNPELHEKYINYKKYLNKTIKEAKRTFYSECILTIKKGDSKTFWKVTNNMLNRNVKTKQDYNHINPNPHTVAEKFNKHFTNIGSTILNSIEIKPPPDINSLVTNSCAVFDITESDTLNEINNLKNKTTSVDGITNIILKQNAQSLVKPMTKLFNQCLTDGIYPGVFKQAVVTPLYKNGERGDLHKYRPISITPSISTIFEKLIKERISNFVNKHKIIHPNQYGFQPNKSTQGALTHLTSEIVKNIDQSKPTIVAFLDITKAFDTVDHTILIDALLKNGIRGRFLNLLQSFLKDRTQRVKINYIPSSRYP